MSTTIYRIADVHRDLQDDESLQHLCDELDAFQRNGFVFVEHENLLAAIELADEIRALEALRNLLHTGQIVVCGRKPYTDTDDEPLFKKGSGCWKTLEAVPHP